MQYNFWQPKVDLKILIINWSSYNLTGRGEIMRLHWILMLVNFMLAVIPSLAAFLRSFRLLANQLETIWTVTISLSVNLRPTFTKNNTKRVISWSRYYNISCGFFYTWMSEFAIAHITEYYYKQIFYSFVLYAGTIFKAKLDKYN